MGCRDEFEDPGCDPEINSAHHPALVINAGANVAQRVRGRSQARVMTSLFHCIETFINRTHFSF